MPEIEVKEISPSQFSAWKSHPVTQIFRQFLTDYAKRMTADAGARWKAGKQDQNVEQFARGCVNALEEMATVEWGAIAQFYGVEANEEKSSDGKPPTE